MTETRDSKAEGNIHEAQRMIRGITPGSLGGRSLPEALAEQAVDFSGRTGVLASFVHLGSPVTLDDERAVTLLRVAQAAMRDIERHAAAQQVRVQLEADAEAHEVRLLVVDDGRGFAVTSSAEPESRHPDGFGLLGMREQARLAGGELEIESRASSGTRVCARLPMTMPTGAYR